MTEHHFSDEAELTQRRFGLVAIPFRGRQRDLWILGGLLCGVQALGQGFASAVDNLGISRPIKFLPGVALQST
ncbi:hypothetical protein HMPREF2757_06630 [Brevibacterium sp. HMSC063G07]|nr:hypothetical protein HMPREF2757_06630 [Brevibacterium sp. HMSC063G07]